MPQAIGVINVIKRIRVCMQDFPRGSKAAQELSIIHIIPGGNGQLLHHIFTACTAICPEAFHCGFGTGSSILPALILPFTALTSLLFLQVPETVIIHGEKALKACNSVFRQMLPQKHAVDAFRIQNLHFTAALSQKKLPCRDRVLHEAGVRERIDNTFYCGVTSQIPEHCIPAPAFGQMAEQAVQHHMHIQAR